MGLLSILPARQADRVIVSITLVGFAASIAWLRLRVAGWRGMPLASVAGGAAGAERDLALRVHELPARGVPLRDHARRLVGGPRSADGSGGPAVLAVLLVCGYFAHLVSLGLTVVGLAVLTALTPGERRPGPRGDDRREPGPAGPARALLPPPERPRRTAPRRTGSTGSPSTRFARGLDRLGWVDPISLATRQALPFSESRWWAFGLLAPVVWCGVGMAILAASTLLNAGEDRSDRSASVAAGSC